MKNSSLSLAQISANLDSMNPPEYVRWNRDRISTCIHFLQRHVQLQGKRTLDLGHDIHVGSLLASLGCDLVGNVAPDELGGHEKAHGSHHYHAPDGRDYEWSIDAFDFEKTFPYQDGIFDLVTAMEVIEHINSTPKTFLAEIKRVLAPNGYVFIATPNAACWAKIMRQFSHCSTYDAKPYSQNFGPRHPMCHVYEYTPWELKELLRAEGFETVKFETWDPYASDPRGVRKELLRIMVSLGLLFSGHLKESALLYRCRGHQIGLLASIVDPIFQTVI